MFFLLFPLFEWVLLFNIFDFVLLLLLLLLLLSSSSSSFVLSSILFINISIVLYPLIFFFLFMPQVKDQLSHSLHLILAYFIFMTTIFRLIVFKFCDFVILL